MGVYWLRVLVGALKLLLTPVLLGLILGVNLLARAFDPVARSRWVPSHVTVLAGARSRRP